MHVVLRQIAFAVNERYDALSPQAQTVLRLVDARRNVATIVRESGLDTVEAISAVTELLAENVVEEWDPAGHTGEVVSSGGKLPPAQGAIDFGRASYLAPASSPGTVPARRAPDRTSSGR
jgi:hypothetical protein